VLIAQSPLCCCFPCAGFSVKQLTEVCQAIAYAADRLPQLAHISMGMELDALLSSSSAAGVSPLAALTQLTSLAFVEYQVGLGSCWTGSCHGRQAATGFLCGLCGAVWQCLPGQGLEATMLYLQLAMQRAHLLGLTAHLVPVSALVVHAP
jgi:hypothetical protein